MKRIWGSFLLPIFVLGDDDLGWFRHGAVNVAEEASSSDLRRDLRPPKDVVVAG